jgi:hypothetical protein
MGEPALFIAFVERTACDMQPEIDPSGRMAVWVYPHAQAIVELVDPKRRIRWKGFLESLVYRRAGGGDSLPHSHDERQHPKPSAATAKCRYTPALRDHV